MIKYTLDDILKFLKKQRIVQWTAIEEVLDVMDDDTISDESVKSNILLTLMLNGLDESEGHPNEKEYSLNKLICFWKAQQISDYTSIIFILDTLDNPHFGESTKREMILEEFRDWELYAIDEDEDDFLIFPKQKCELHLINGIMTIGIPLN
jgi:hypothetical protein